MLSLLFTITTFLTVIFSFCLGVYTIVRSRRALVYWLWFFTSIAVVIWGVGYLLTIKVNIGDVALAVKYLKVVYFGATWLPILFFHFVLRFLFKKQKTLLIFGYVLVVTFLFINLFSQYFIKGAVYLENFGYYEEVNLPFFYLYLFYFFFYIIYSVYLLIREFRRAEGIRKRQLLFLIWASFFGFGGGMTNFIMALTGWYPLGQLFVFLYPILITYGIFLPEVKIKI